MATGNSHPSLYHFWVQQHLNHTVFPQNLSFYFSNDLIYSFIYLFTFVFGWASSFWWHTSIQWSTGLLCLQEAYCSAKQKDMSHGNRHCCGVVSKLALLWGVKFWISIWGKLCTLWPPCHRPINFFAECSPWFHAQCIFITAPLYRESEGKPQAD